ncbi:MAG: DUF4367 domain-containing protein [Oscillospiraceae bacterium]|nr:DUF4367 domain-containing protein [Oscillospiraceae bacterium]
MTLENGTITLEALAAMAAAEVEQRRWEELPDLEELNRRFAPSPGFEEKVRRTMRRVKRKAGAQRWLRHGKRLLVSAMACITLLSGTLMQAEAVQEAVGETIMDWKEKNVDIYLTNESPTRTALPGNIHLEYMCEGYELEWEDWEGDQLYSAFYEKEIGTGITVTLAVDDGWYMNAMDSEYTDFHTVVIDGQEMMWCYHHGGPNSDGASHTLLWRVDGMVWNVSGTIDLAEAIQVAQGIKVS